MKFERTQTFGWEPAFHGLRNPYDSWAKADSEWKEIPFSDEKEFAVGPNDKALALRMCNGGSPHNKFLRQIFAATDICASMMWWRQFDTYRAGVEKDACSTMHTLHRKEFQIDQFDHRMLVGPKWSEADNFSEGHVPEDVLSYVCKALNEYRGLYLAAKESGDEARAKMFWLQMNLLLPQSYLQMRTVTISYAALANICRQRKGHKLAEWAEFIEWAKGLPNSWLIFGEEGDSQNVDGN